ncbi:hypothetical protein B0J11DRAFT_91271 [Dendryphion nanum]|uniref:USP domain-containing protein n=1 Tax=Dendryphion nanum TaxID=256645 RepID=A0A9P9DEJ7_9PLEO|nr:hypothetical protein B0J11DRAFT_91271 [Dendryphion nanum]
MAPPPNSSLMGPQPQPRVGREQVDKNKAARSVRSAWPITRTQRGGITKTIQNRSRGFDNGGNWCYRNATLQILLHIPKFMNIVIDHNAPGPNGVINNVCPLAQQARHCYTCRLKALIQEYWGPNNINATTNFPNFIPNNHPAFASITRRFRARFGQNQDDPADALLWYLSRIYRSLHHQNPQAQFDSLFSITIRTGHQCPNPNCNHVNLPYPPNTPSDVKHNGLNGIPFHTTNPTTVQAAIDDHYAPAPYHMQTVCSQCNQGATMNVVQKIVAAPENLLVTLALNSGSLVNGVWRLTKTMNHITLTDPLDLTNMQVYNSKPLWYDLISVSCHGGASGNGGHWISTVKGYGHGRYQLSDRDVYQVPKSTLTDNPQQLPYGGPMEVAVLMYKRGS